MKQNERKNSRSEEKGGKVELRQKMAKRRKSVEEGREEGIKKSKNRKKQEKQKTKKRKQEKNK